MFKMKSLLFIGVVLVLAAASCKPGPARVTPKPSPPAAETPKATPTPAPQATPTPVPQATPTEEALQLEKISAGLEKLSSYKIQWTISFDGKDGAGNPVKWEAQWLEDYTANPPARRLTLKSTEKEANLMMVQMGESLYIVAEGSCLMGTAPETRVLERFTPEFGIRGGTFVGYDTVAGVKAKHYTFDEKAFTWGGFGKVKGEVWVAPEGYVLKETAEAYGKDFFFEKGEGTIRWTWELTEINKPFTIEVPAECAQLQPRDVPILPDASELMVAQGFIAYKSATPFQNAVNFYKEQMIANGWKAAEGSMEMGNMAVLNYSKEGRTASVSIQAEEKGVTVMITITQ